MADDKSKASEADEPSELPAAETESGKPIVGDEDLVPPGTSPGTGQ